MEPLKNPTLQQQRELKQEIAVARKLRVAIQFCKAETGIEDTSAGDKLDAEQRMSMERCIVQNYLIPFGNNYFGKRDFIYLDTYGDNEV